MRQIETIRYFVLMMVQIYVFATAIGASLFIATYIYSSIFYFHNGIPFYRIYCQKDKTKEQKKKEIKYRIATVCLLCFGVISHFVWFIRIACFIVFLILHGKLNRMWTKYPGKKSKRIEYYFFPFIYYLDQF